MYAQDQSIWNQVHVLVHFWNTHELFETCMNCLNKTALRSMKAKEPLSCLLQQSKVYSKDRSIWKQVHVLCAFLKRALLDFPHFNPAVRKTVVNIQCLDCVNIDLTRLRNFHRLYHTSRTCEEGSLQSPPCPCKRRPGSWLSSQDSNNPFSTSKFLRKSHRPEYSIRSIIPWSWWKLNSFSLEKGFPLPKH